MKDNMLKNKIAGALYGVAIGDALGAPLEFMSAEEIEKRHGYVTDMIGGGWLNVAPGETTDDTAMTLAVAEGILENPDDPIPAIGQRFIAWAQSSPKDIGGTCAASIRRAAAKSPEGRPTETQWFKAAEILAATGGRTAGNGALMRTVYPGLYYKSRLLAIETAGAIAQMTHWAGESTAACHLYTDMLHLITEGKTFNIFELTKDTPYYDTLKDINEIDKLNPTGYVVDSMKCSLAAFWHTERFDDAVTFAANLGGDADTIAAVTGGLAGAFYGYVNIPDKWIAALSQSDRSRLDALVKAAVENRGAAE